MQAAERNGSGCFMKHLNCRLLAFHNRKISRRDSYGGLRILLLMQEDFWATYSIER